MSLIGIATRPVLAAAWDAAQRRAGEMGVLTVSPAAQAGAMLESMNVADALTVALIHAGTWASRGEEKVSNFWKEIADELQAVADHDAVAAQAKEGRGAA